MNILNQSTRKIVLAGTHIEPGKIGSIKKELYDSLSAEFTVKNMFRDGKLLVLKDSEEKTVDNKIKNKKKGKA